MPMIPIQKYSVFADESGIGSDGHMLVGATVVETIFLEQIYSRLSDIRNAHSIHAEFKWSKVSEEKLPAYLAVVDLFFEYLQRRAIWFCVTTFDNSKWDHGRFNDNDPDIGISKLYYQMLLHQVVGRFGDLATLFICLDRRRSSTSLDDLHRILNKGAGREYKLTFGPVRVLTARDSKADDILQMNDVILGAVSSVKNGRHKAENARPAKRKLAEYVLTRSGLKTYDKDSPKRKMDFSVWNRRPR